MKAFCRHHGAGLGTAVGVVVGSTLGILAPLAYAMYRARGGTNLPHGYGFLWVLSLITGLIGAVIFAFVGAFVGAAIQHIMTHQLIASFARAAIQQRQAFAAGDVKTANEMAYEQARLFQQISSLPEPEQAEQFLALLKNPEPAIRFAAAAYGLCLDEAACIDQLMAMAAGGEQYALEAQQCLERWCEGTWALNAPPTLPSDASPALKAPMRQNRS